ncbi:TraB/GumN family protein [Flavobacterium muglaense]|uniref:TraB/GumN family protein n=1 Tax=Flavobacterium muglaense TaxID=2764716 RepID=A0A923N1R4_9FLAO|nr:TraB/GumN family protein [Flavobacterium muglaense]MBC5838510.1 TraB/GumN family protein [Flavobacterium muglaense]MBC5845044.1 TraB/GumN family protein [Flavobacterium muglaense]
MKIFRTILLGLPIVTTVMLNAQSQSTLLWKIEKQGKKTSYVFLSTNVCSSGDNLIKLESEVLPKVDVIAVEQNLNTEENKKSVQNSIAVTDNSQKLKNILSSDDYQKIIAYAKEKAGMTEQMVNMFKPFYVNAFLLMSANPCGATSGYRIENDLQSFSLKNKKTYTELLGVNDYVQLMDAGTKDYWKNNISYIFNNPDEAKAAIENKNKFYSSGNEDALKTLYTYNQYLKIKYSEDMVKKYADIILPKIEKLTTDSAVLFTIDPGYFTTTDNNLYENLKKAGYTITAVTF